MRRPKAPASASRPLVSPLQPSVVYATDTPDTLDGFYNGAEEGFTYSREGHPNARALAGMIDALEGTEGGIAGSSGMAAGSLAVMASVSAGGHVLASEHLYGRSLRLLTQDLPRFGITTSLFDPTAAVSARAALRPETKAILVEVVSNPTLRVADMEGLTALAGEHGLTLIVDNTFTTPRLFTPLSRGAGSVLHSVTKLLAGHSDAMLGYVAAQDAAVAEHLEALAVTLGMTASPFDCWLAERGLLTFPLRQERCQNNAQSVAEALADWAGIKEALYPGLPGHPDHNRTRALLPQGAGTMLSFTSGGGRAAANAFSDGAGPLPLAPTLGDVTTTLSHPASSSHRALSEADRAALGISEGFFRLSVGVEPVDDILAALGRGLDAARAVSA